MELPDKVFYRIGEVARWLDVEPHVLRYWETEFRIKPRRSASGQRLYRRAHVERLSLVKRLLHTEGYTIAGARRVLAAAGAQRPRETVNKAEAAGVVQDQEALEAWRKSARAELEALHRLIQEARELSVS